MDTHTHKKQQQHKVAFIPYPFIDPYKITQGCILPLQGTYISVTIRLVKSTHC